MKYHLVTNKTICEITSNGHAETCKLLPSEERDDPTMGNIRKNCWQETCPAQSLALRVHRHPNIPLHSHQQHQPITHEAYRTSYSHISQSSPSSSSSAGLSSSREVPADSWRPPRQCRLTQMNHKNEVWQTPGEMKDGETPTPQGVSMSTAAEARLVPKRNHSRSVPWEPVTTVRVCPCCAIVPTMKRLKWSSPGLTQMLFQKRRLWDWYDKVEEMFR